MNKVRILVLGDVGCSPRMKNHCLSFARSSWEVYFSGYLQSELPNSITENCKIHIEPIEESPSFINQRKENKFFLIMKVLFTSFYLFFFLLTCKWTNILMVQNPPAVPTFVIIWLISKIRGISLMVDWHNYGYTLMERSSNRSGFLMKLYKNVEVKFSRKHLKAKQFCVSKAFSHDLLLKWDIKTEVLYDLPWKIDGVKNLISIHNLLIKLSEHYPVLKGDSEYKETTAITEKGEDDTVIYRVDRPALIVSSCSWTVDDDFETLFKALDRYNASILSGQQLPNIICVITGKGPMKRYFERIVSEQEWCHVSVIMPWLETDDYPIMLSAADLGICLHNSTSGLDLPMKVVDMFSVALPVLALNYKCLDELVIDRFNGRLFSSDKGLYNHLCELLPAICLIDQTRSDIEQYRNNIVFHSKHGTWQDHWEQVLLPVASKLVYSNQNESQ